MFNCQHQLDPVPEKDVRLGVPLVNDLQELPQNCFYFVRVDPAFSEKKEACDTAIVVCGVDMKGHRWFVDGWIGKEKKPSVVIGKAIGYMKKWNAKNIGIEAVAAQSVLAEAAYDGIVDPKGNILQTNAVVKIERSTDTQKWVRLLDLQPPTERGEVHIVRSNPIANVLIEQWKAFPYGKMDALDAAHDCWVKTYAPTATSAAEAPKYSAAWYMNEILKKNKKSPFKVPFVNNIELMNW